MKPDPDALRFSPTALLFQGETAGAGVSMFILRQQPGGFVELHVHPYTETFVLLSGRGRWTAGDVVEELVPDEVIVVPANTPHGFRNLGEEEMLVVSVHESPRMQQEFLGRDPA